MLQPRPYVEDSAGVLWPYCPHGDGHFFRRVEPHVGNCSQHGIIDVDVWLQRHNENLVGKRAANMSDRPYICPHCKTDTGSTSGAESWHDICLARHREEFPECQDHKLCKRARLHAEFLRRTSQEQRPPAGSESQP